MRLHLVTGGARSGKSRYAESLTERLAEGHGVTYIATAQALDPEMEERIALHQARRPANWTTLECSINVGDALQDSAAVVLLDCLTLLASNAFLREVEHGAEAARAAVLAEVDTLLTAASARDGDLIVVTNEVGFGIVPDTRYGRWFRDCLGEANVRVAEASERVVLVVAGCPLVLRNRASAEDSAVV